VRTGIAVAALALALTALGAGLAHGGDSAAAVLRYLGPVTVVTVAAVLLVARRVAGLRRQLIAAALTTGAGLAVAILAFVQTMYLSPHDALYTVLLGGYALLVGGWSAWLLGDRALGRLAAAERARRDLVAAVSHDLRTPITSLQLIAEAVDDEILDPDTRQEYLRRMRTHLGALSAMIEDLFELSRLEAGEIRWSMEQVRLDTLLVETVDALRPQADAEGIAVRTDLRPEVQGARADPEQLQRVLFNLIQNAIRHTPADGSVVVRARTAGRGVEIEVADSGAGIAAADRDRVFDPFFQAGDRAARSGGGAGLGLAISRAIIEAHGGRIWLVNDGPGTRVRFNLPAGTQP
jgi:signal transduction histidine kinase